MQPMMKNLGLHCFLLCGDPDIFFVMIRCSIWSGKLMTNLNIMEAAQSDVSGVEFRPELLLCVAAWESNKTGINLISN